MKALEELRAKGYHDLTVYTPVPSHARRGSRSPSARPSSAAHTACEHTSAADDATLV